MVFPLAKSAVPIQPPQPSPAKEELFKLIQKNLAENNISEAIDNLLLSMVNITAASQARKIFQFLFRLLPHMQDKLSDLMKYLPSLLRYSSDLRFEQQQLAKCLALTHIPKTVSPLSAFSLAMDYLGQALLIQDSLELHQQATQLLLTSYLETGLFDQRLDTCVSKYDSQNPSAQVEEFDRILTQIHQLKRFCRHEQDRETLRRFFQKARNTLTRLKSNKLPIYQQFEETISKGLTDSFPPSDVYPTQRYKLSLQEIRNYYSKFSNQKVKKTRNFQGEITQEYIKFFQELLKDAINVLGPPPCEYDLRAMGSLGRGEPGPFSDIEFFILLRKDTPENREYFKNLVQFLELQIKSLGESADIQLVFTCLEQKNRSGFRIDKSGNPSIQKDYLIAIPAKMAEKQKNDPTDDDPCTVVNHSLLRSISLCPHPSSLFQEYQTALLPILSEFKKGSLRLHQYRALELIRRRLKDFRDQWPEKDSRSYFQHDLQLKKRFIELLNHLLTDMALYWGIETHEQDGKERSSLVIEETNILDIINALTIRKNVFTQRTSSLLQEAVENLYALRLRLHLSYDDQNELAVLNTRSLRGSLKDQELKQLKKIFWTILFPLYASLSNVFKPEDSSKPNERVSIDGKLAKRFEKIFQNFDLSEVAYEETLSQSASYKRSILHLANDDASQTLIRSEPHSLEGIPQVKVITPSSSHFYLTEDVVHQILILDGPSKGELQKKYEGAAHAVTFLPGIHLKLLPVQSLMEYAIHDLWKLISGLHLTPISELVRFEVLFPNEKPRVYPVLISETIPGSTLKEKAAPAINIGSLAWKRWTWMILCTLLTLPGDGLASNYIFNGQDIYSIDNDISFVIPFTKEYGLFKRVHFCSALFFLYSDVFLDPHVLDEFCHLDVDEILSKWMEDLIQKEKEYLSLFSEEERKRWFENKDPQKRFSATVVFYEGAITNLKLQFHRLQNTLLLKQKKVITALDLLQQMVQICDFNHEVEVGPYVAQAYREALSKPNLSLTQKISEVRRDRGGSLSLPEMHKACLGLENALSFEKVEKLGRWTPAEAQQELYVTLLKRSSPYLSLRSTGKRKIVRANFKGLLQDDPELIKSTPPLSETRQRLILRALIAHIEMVPEKPIAVTLQHCSVLNSATLESFLHEDLEELDLSFCTQIQDKDVQTIQQRCPLLKTLKLSGCSQLRSVMGSGVFSNYPLDFSRTELKTLTGHTGGVITLIPLEGGKKITSASSDGTIRIWDIESGRMLKTLTGHTGGVIMLIPLEGGKKITSASSDGTIRIWDVESGRELKTLTGHTGWVITLIPLEDGKKITSASSDGTIRIWDAESGRMLKTLKKHTSFVERTSSVEKLIPKASFVETLIPLEGGKKLASGSSDNTIRIWDVESGRELKTLTGHIGLVETLIPLEGGKKLASGSSDNTIRIWDVESGRELKTLTGHIGLVETLIPLEGGKKLASGSSDNTIRIWDVESGRELKTLNRGFTQTLTPLESVKKIALAGDVDGSIHIWDAKLDRVLKTLTGHKAWVTTLIPLEGGKKIASGSFDKTIRIRSTELGLEHLYLDQCENIEVIKLKASSLKTLIVNKNPQLNKVELECEYFPQMEFNECPKFDVNLFFSQHFSHVLKKGHADIFNTLLNPSICLILAKILNPSIQERLFLLIERSKKEPYLAPAAATAITILNFANISFAGREFRGIQIPGAHLEKANLAKADLRNADLTGVNFTKAVLSFAKLDGAKMGNVQLQAGLELKTLTRHTDAVLTLIPLEREKKLASGSSGPNICIWDAESGQELKTLTGHTSAVSTLIPLEGGKKLASGSEDKTIRIWNVESGRELKTLMGHTDAVRKLIPLEDGKKLASGSLDGTVRIWDIESGCILKAFFGHMSRRTHIPNRTLNVKSGHVLKVITVYMGEVLTLIPLERGKKLASGNHDNIIRVWDNESGHELKKLTGHTDVIQTLIPLEEGKKIASGSSDNTIRIWDVESGRELTTLRGHMDSVLTLIPLEGGKEIASGSEDKAIRIWDVESGCKLLSISHPHAIITLTTQDNLLYAGDAIGGLWCWRLSENHRESLLLWATNPPSTLCADVVIGNILHLSPENQELMLQHGAIKASPISNQPASKSSISIVYK